MNETPVGHKPIIIDKQILFAPALALRVSTLMREFLNKLSGKLVVPSFYHHEFRKHRGSTIAAYKAVFNMIRTLRKTKLSHGNIPTVIFIDSKDELIPHSKISEIINKYKLTNWRLIRIDNQHEYEKNTNKIHHLIITESLVGESCWNMVKANIEDLLNS